MFGVIQNFRQFGLRAVRSIEPRRPVPEASEDSGALGPHGVNGLRVCKNRVSGDLPQSP